MLILIYILILTFIDNIEFLLTLIHLFGFLFWRLDKSFLRRQGSLTGII
jgi:hypothetical protein